MEKFYLLTFRLNLIHLQTKRIILQVQIYLNIRANGYLHGVRLQKGTQE